MKFLKIIFVLANFSASQEEYVGLDRINRIVSRYEGWIERYADDYKKKYRLERAVNRTRRFFSWWIKGKKNGCDPQNSELDRSELEMMDEDMERFLPDNAMLKVFTYQSQMERVQNIFFKNCSEKINEKLTDVVRRVTRDFTTAFGAMNNDQ
ncbi:Oidioi.mRNA.OKI2018_I69.chr2.g4044.t1.cds [Oikopleura dioica]|uniref:Oidioi.mRNA.OKI2018_I69.chr2.g4044.t1.cds n=1 Tax=Oikopleura dioica TaxID=34765 RepID=A0ABN7SZY0_OIKDI|nr:Oidioi.mRNA.OKI2018_I69.chr2.g4044.t1.cds [Oikopleura dioica]